MPKLLLNVSNVVILGQGSSVFEDVVSSESIVVLCLQDLSRCEHGTQTSVPEKWQCGCSIKML